MTLRFFHGQIAFLKSRGVAVQAVSSGDERSTLKEFGILEDIRVHPIDMARHMAPISDAVSLIHLWCLFKRLRPDIVHSHSPKAALLGTLAARGARVPNVVLSIFGLPQMTRTGLNRRFLDSVTKLECRLADRVWCDSPSMRTYIIQQQLCAPEKLVVLGNGSVNGVDSLGGFSPERQQSYGDEVRRHNRIPPEDLVIGFVGRITADKGMHELTDAWRLLSAERSDLHLLLVGPLEQQDPLRPDDLAFLREHPRVHITGEQDDIGRYYAAMDIFVMPSYREGFGVTNIEAASMGLPVVATNIPGCVDSVQDGVTGSLVPPRDSLSLLLALRRYCDSDSLRIAHGQAGRQRVIADFQPAVIWQQLYDLYIELA